MWKEPRKVRMILVGLEDGGKRGMSQGIHAFSRNWKAQGNRFFLRASRSPSLDFKPERPMSDFSRNTR